MLPALPELEKLGNLAVTLDRLKNLATTLSGEIKALDRFRSPESLDVDLARDVQNFEIALIRGALIRTGGVQVAAAKLLNINATTLNAKIKKYGINLSEKAVFFDSVE